MDRKRFLQTLAAMPLAGAAVHLTDLNRIAGELPPGPAMPVLFLGHGSPMNAIEENEFVNGFRKVAATIPKPAAILCISAHWETRGTFVTAMEHPKTIHDFGGFPKQLFDVQYPAPGSPWLATETQRLVTSAKVQPDMSWGLDHGAWSVIKHLYPKADVPVIQMSIDYTKDPQYHYNLAKQLVSLRKKGVLIIGSGNIVHNLGLVDWKNMRTDNYAFDWALEARQKVNKLILDGDHKPLVNFKTLGKEVQRAVPSPEHYLPLIYALALKSDKEKVSLFNDKAVGGSLSMTSVKIG